MAQVLHRSPIVRAPGVRVHVPSSSAAERRVEELGRKLYALLRDTEELELRPRTPEANEFPLLCLAAGRLIEAGLVELFECQGRLYVRLRRRSK